MNFKVLIISHNSFSSFQNMGKTLRSLFGSFSKEQLHQLYFHSSYPDIDVCNSLFRITDIEVLYSIIGINRKPGSLVDKGKIKSGNILFPNTKAKFYHKAKKKNNFLVVARDILWGLRGWDTRKLNKWINKIDPDIIFFAAGDSIFPYTISLKIAKRMDIPLVIYFCDDFYNIKEKKVSPIYHIHQYVFKSTLKKVGAQASSHIYISPSLKKKYTKLLGKSGVVIMTPYQNSIDKTKKVGDPLVLTYAGNVSLNRWKTLKSIGKVLAKINNNEKKAILNIYSGSQESEITNQLTIENGMYFKGNISYKKLKYVIKKSDILVHVESFEKETIERVRHSISSKIPDYLSSNRLILAVGPKEVASIAYLKENDAAYTICSVATLENDINLLIKNLSDTKSIISNAKQLSQKNHCEKRNSLKLKMLFKEVLKSNKSH